MKDSKVILLDNPTSGLDYKSTQNLIKFLKKEKRNGKIIILTSYNSDFVLQVSDRVIVIDDKKVILDEDKYKAMSNKDLLNRVHFETPNIINFENRVLELKKINVLHSRAEDFAKENRELYDIVTSRAVAKLNIPIWCK